MPVDARGGFMSNHTLMALAAAFGAVIFGVMAFSLQTANTNSVRAGGTLTRIRTGFTFFSFAIGVVCLIAALYFFTAG
jgi:hypothetical protein